MKKTKLGMVQINNSFSEQEYLPYSVGILQAYAQKHASNIDEFEFDSPVYKRITVDNALEKLDGAGMVFFSVYVWNFRLSLEIARRLKYANKKVVIVFGGPQVPGNGTEMFIKKNRFIDLACRSAGESVIVSILENYRKRDWEKVPSVCFLNKRGEFVQTELCARSSKMDEIPSPYLEGVFDQLLLESSRTNWVALWETNRGCPFTCAYCDWGSATRNKVFEFNMERLYQEIEWFSKNKIEFVFCCDANFAILPRDIKIVQYFAEIKSKTGYPKALSVQSTKNFTDAVYNTYRAMENAGLSKGVSLSLQSVNPDTLRNTRRQNISAEAFKKIQQKLTSENIETFTDIILALPSESYDTFADGISSVIDNGQHNRIQFNNLSILPNAEMGDLDFQKKFGFEVVETDIINIHGSLDAIEEITEKQLLVIGTSTMPKKDWIRARVFGWMASLLHFDKLLQIVFILLNKEYSVSYREMIELFSEKDDLTPILFEIKEFFIKKAMDIQHGGKEFCESKEWLNIWWPPDELILVKLCAEGKMEDFYKEVETALERYLDKKDIKGFKAILRDSLDLNEALLKRPKAYKDVEIMLSHNIWDVYFAVLRGINISLNKGDYTYVIERESQNWSNWDDWCREVIWWGNKKGAYMYKCNPLKRGEGHVALC